MKVLILSLLVTIVDQLSKLYVKYAFEYGRPHKVIGDVVRLTYIENPGMAFGIEVSGQLFFTVFALIVSVVIFFYILRAQNERLSLRVALALILGGGIGNLIDRFLYGRVVDFIEVVFRGARWPIFNIADSAVFIGMIILITIVLFDRGFKETQRQQQIQAEKPFPKSPI